MNRLAIAATALVVVGFLCALPARERTLRIGAVLYLAACVLCLAIDSPVGSNIERYGVLLAETAANFEARINDLSEQRADLLKKLQQAGGKTSRTSLADASAQMTALNQEVETLRARIAVEPCPID